MTNRFYSSLDDKRDAGHSSAASGSPSPSAATVSTTRNHRGCCQKKYSRLGLGSGKTPAPAVVDPQPEKHATFPMPLLSLVTSPVFWLGRETLKFSVQTIFKALVRVIAVKDEYSVDVSSVRIRRVKEFLDVPSRRLST
jgi:hypothetical protein